MIDEVYCVNIKKRPDRLEKFKKNQEHKLTSKGLKVQYTTDWDMNKDAEDITPEWLSENNITVYNNWALKKEAWFETARWRWWNRHLTNGEVGCAVSHSEVWKQAKGYTLILEDDVELTRNWYVKVYNALDTLKVIDKKWDLLYVGRVEQSDKEKTLNLISSNMRKPNYSFCTYSYMLSPSGLEKINKYKYRENIIPSDEFLNATFMEHPRDDIKLIYPPTLRAYAMWPDAAWHDISMGSDTGSKELSTHGYVANEKKGRK